MVSSRTNSGTFQFVVVSSTLLFHARQPYADVLQLFTLILIIQISLIKDSPLLGCVVGTRFLDAGIYDLTIVIMTANINVFFRFYVLLLSMLLGITLVYGLQISTVMNLKRLIFVFCLNLLSYVCNKSCKKIT